MNIFADTLQIYLATMPFKRVQDEETAGGPHALRAGRQLRL